MPALPDVTRVAFLTRAYPRMRHAVLTAVTGPAMIWNLRSARLDEFWGLLAGVLFALGAVPLLERWADRRFGRVKTEESESDSWALLRPILFGASFLPVWKVDLWAVRAGGPSVMLLGLAGLALWMTIRDWPFRPYILIFFVACLSSVLMLEGIRDGEVLLQWRIRTDTACVLAWMLVGFFDFMLLRRLMPGCADSHEREHADAV